MRAVSVFSLAECLACPARSGLAGAAAAELERLGIAVRAIPETAAAAIAEVRATTGLRMPDAVVYWMAASNESRLATFDQNLGRQAHADGIALVEPTTDQPT